MHKRFVSSPRHGFTIVELLVVVVVIGILAALVLVGYNGITRSAVNARIVSELSTASKKIELYKVDNGGLQYPSSLADVNYSVDTASGITLTYTASVDMKTYCMQGALSGRTYFKVNSSSNAQPGICEGAVGVPSDGNINQGSPANATAQMSVDGDGGGFKVGINAAWTELALSWDAVSNAERYEVQVDKSNGTWLYVNKTTGSDLATGVQTCAVRQSGTYSEYCSAQIASSVTNVTWTHPHIFQSAATETFNYRVRAIVGGVAQPWYTASLPLTAGGQLTKVQNFKVTPVSTSDSTSYIVNWNSVATNNVPKAKIQIQVNKNNAGWVMVNQNSGSNIATGAQTCAARESGTYSEYCSAQIDPATTTLTWNHLNAIPTAVTDTFEYRIRLRSNNITNMYSDWSYYTLVLPATSSLATPTGFTVNPVSGWAGMSLAWTNASNINTPNAKIQIQVNRNGAGWAMVNQTSGSNIATGAQTCAARETGTYSEYCSAQIPATTSSLSWAHTYSTPPSAGQTYDYRIRYRSESIQGLYSDWVTASVTR